MSSQEPEDLNWRNLLRMRVLEVADDLDERKISGPKGAARLRKLADSDIQEMDEADIEIDFEDGGGDAGPLLALGGAVGSTKAHPTDPVETALARVLKLRDRNHGLKIVAETPGQQDIDDYREAVESLRQALNEAALKSPDKE